ncbi:hypothetical protein CKAH01_14437 [Colletotrichum kahawae]|uniref:Uncharacterized protein n=1 Tax=Colletotrichum kahawae TaxID=34407 RepID=A0AAE0DAA1_COLKA|nr:hypothetical protein CKAH01_14437 [Colletotrichum kahawae]
MLTRGLLTACEEPRAAATPGNDETGNTLRIITSKLYGRVQELFYYDSSDLIILHQGWGRTGHIVSDCLAIPESDKGQFGASPQFPKHIGLEIDLKDFKLLLQWEYPPTNRGQQYEHFRCFVDSMMNWLNHGATLHFIGKLGSDYPCVQREYFELYQIEGTVFYDSKYRYLPVIPATFGDTCLVKFFIWQLKKVVCNINGPDFCKEMFYSLKGLAQQQILPDKTVA